MSRRKFQIVMARTAGFCMGVRRAVRMVLDAANNPEIPLPIQTPGPLIHNRQVLQVLESRGILVMEDKDSPPMGTGVVRAHGLSESEQKRLRSGCRQLLDATCPHVRRVQEIVREHAAKGYMCVIVGDAGHAEVNGVLSYAGNRGHVVAGPQDVEALPAADRVVVVAQTTQDAELFGRTAERVRQRYGECLVFQTICESTQLRQAEVRELARQVQAMVVVGGHNSANTQRLADICAAAGTPTFRVETERELDLDRILRYDRVGLTAGASTPNWMIRKVVRRLKDEHLRRTRPLAHAAVTVLRGLVAANVYAAGGAAALTLANVALLPQAPRSLGLCAAVSFFFILSQHILNQYARRQSLYLSEPQRADFFMANERPLLALGACSGALAAFLAFLLSWWALGLVAAGYVAGLLYRVRLPQTLARRLGFRTAEQLPGSKELFVALAMATLGAAVPALSAAHSAAQWRAAAVAFAASFLLAFQRTLALDVRDVMTDQLVGRETLGGLLGPRMAERIFFILSALTVGIVAAGMAWAAVGRFGFAFLAVVPYMAFWFLRLSRKGKPEGELAEAAVDGTFYIVGALALARAAWGGL